MIYSKNHQSGIAVLPQFPVNPGLNGELWRIGNGIYSSNARPHGQESIQTLSKIVLFVCSLDITGADIINNGIAKQILLYLFRRNVFGFFADNDQNGRGSDLRLRWLYSHAWKNIPHVPSFRQTAPV